MKAFVVSVNGQRICTAGIGPDGVLSTNLNWIGGGPHSGPDGDFHLSVGGLDSRTREQIDYETPPVGVGDTITIQLVEADVIDPESKRYLPDLQGFT